jgi:glucan biosynthesis protein C
MNSQSTNLGRRYELDWLRLMAILAVCVYHCTLIFAPDAYQIKNPTIYPYLDDLGAFTGLWGMPLILIISGASAFYALGKYNAGKYIKGLVARLLVPLVIGIFTHAALQVYLERLQDGTFSGSFLEFYPHYFEGLYAFGGNFAWMGMHLWYLEALFIYSVLCLPLFLWFKKSASGQRLLQRLSNFLGGKGAIYLLTLPVLIVVNLFDPEGLGTTVLGGWSIFNYLVFFILGFVIFSSERMLVSIKCLRWVSLAAGIFIWGIFDMVWGVLGDPNFGTWQFLCGSALWCLCAWCWLMAIFGFGIQHLRRSKPFLSYANEAVLPFYILHQSTIVPIAFFVVRWAIPDIFKFFVILLTTFVIVMVIYEFLVRRFNLLRFLFGMKPISKMPAVQPKEVQVFPIT